MNINLSSQFKENHCRKKFVDIDSQTVYRFASKQSINGVMATYKLLSRNKRLNKYLPQDISFSVNMVKYRYVFGHNLYTFDLKENFLYLKLLWDFFSEGIYFGDLRRENIIYDGKKLTIIDLEWYILKNKKIFLSKCFKWIFSYDFKKRKWVK